MDTPSPRFPAATPKPAWRRILVALSPLVVIGLGAAGIASMIATRPEPEKRDEAPRPPAVQIAQATQEKLRLSVAAQGSVHPETEVDIAAEGSGRLVWVSPALVAGGAFSAGQPLARIDARDAELAVVRARAEVAQARERIAREEAEGQLAQQDWEELGAGKPASALTLRQPQLAEARAALAAAQAQVRQAEVGLARTVIRAPFSGRVREKRADIGQYVGPGSAIARAFATDVMEARIPLSDSDLAALGLKPGFAGAGPQVALSAVVAGAPRRWTGRLVRIEPVVDAQTRSVQGVVTVSNPFGAGQEAPLAPGLFVNAAIEGARIETLVRVPRAALRKEDEVLVVRADDTLDLRRVARARSGPEGAWLRAGVAPGERVVISALGAPSEGLKVRVTNAPAVRPAPAKAVAPKQEG
jgi:RND family efflux transporter MFP subunit